MATCSITTLESDGCDNQFLQAANDEVLFRALLLQLACNISNGGGGVTSGSGAPVTAPSGSTGIYFDTDTGVQYNYYSGAWH